MSTLDLYSGYKSVESGQATGTTDTEYSVLATLKYSGRTVFRTDQTVTVKANLTTNDAITITSSMSPYTIDDLIVHRLFVTNASGSTANLKILSIGPVKSP